MVGSWRRRGFIVAASGVGLVTVDWSASRVDIAGRKKLIKRNMFLLNGYPSGHIVMADPKQPLNLGAGKYRYLTSTRRGEPLTRWAGLKRLMFSQPRPLSHLTVKGKHRPRDRAKSVDLGTRQTQSWNQKKFRQYRNIVTFCRSFGSIISDTGRKPDDVNARAVVVLELMLCVLSAEAVFGEGYCATLDLFLTVLSEQYGHT